MSIQTLADVEFGEQLPTFTPDTSLNTVRKFAHAVGWQGGRFEDHERARKEGFPGALVPGIMGMGFLTSTVHQWCADAHVEQIDTVFRAPMIADEPCFIEAVVTDIDEERSLVELDMTLKNNLDETRVFGTARVRLPKAG